MSKLVKEDLTQSYRKSYSGVADACVVDVTKLKVQDVTRFRQEMRSRNIRVEVIKNSLARRALAGTGLAPLAAGLSGPCALVTGGDSIIDVARALLEARKTYAKLELKKAVLEGDTALITVEELSRMRGRREVLGDLAGLLASPGRALAGSLVGPAGRLAGCLKTLADQEAPAET